MSLRNRPKDFGKRDPALKKILTFLNGGAGGGAGGCLCRRLNIGLKMKSVSKKRVLD